MSFAAQSRTNSTSWERVLSRHFPKTHKRRYQAIIVYLQMVNMGLKPSYLWDIPIYLTPQQMAALLNDLRVEGLVRRDLHAVGIGSDVLVVLGHHQEACLYFRQAQDVRSDFLPALKNLQSCCNLAVERWHYRMLNDNRRNQGFRSAITRAVGQGFNTVLDIGCGTGILSLFATEAGAIEVFACDGSHSMVQLAAKVLEANNAADKVKLINKLSYDLKVPQDLPSRCSSHFNFNQYAQALRDNHRLVDKLSLIVTETLDAGLFGEHILQTVSHAWDSLLVPGGRVIPAGATLWVCAVECPHLAARYQLEEDSTGLDWRGIHLYSAGEEQYDCEDMNSLPGGFRFLTEPVPALLVDFNDPEQLQQILSGKRNNAKVCEVLESGEVHVVLAWFTLQLDAQEELSTCPIDEHKAECWDQAVFPFVCVQYVRAGQYLELQVGYHGRKLSVSAQCCREHDNQPKMTNEGRDNGIVFNNSKVRTLNVSNQDKHKMFSVTKSDNSKQNTSIDAWEGGFKSNYDKCSVSFKEQTTDTNLVRELHGSANNFIGETCKCNCNYLNIENNKHNILGSGDVTNETLDKKETDDIVPISRLSHKFSKMLCPLHMKAYFVPQKVLRFLNDKSWMDTLSQVAVHVLQSKGKFVTQFDILDLSPFPVLGLQLMKGIEKARLWCISSEIKEVVLSVLDVNGVSAERIQFIKLEDGQENLSCSTFKFDLVVAHMFDLTGEISGSAVAMLPLINSLIGRKISKQNTKLRPLLGALLQVPYTLAALEPQCKHYLSCPQIVLTGKECGGKSKMGPETSGHLFSCQDCGQVLDEGAVYWFNMSEQVEASTGEQ
uniref:Uncharacterized protein n=1 Tax=Timema bartmani TaxID=61472 RepID=A0A7R9FCF9_9NEOP|nr:unnamed protein product [Timema bartmani]